MRTVLHARVAQLETAPPGQEHDQVGDQQPDQRRRAAHDEEREEVEPAALGWTIEAFVEVYCEGRVPPDRMREMVSNIPEVVEAYTVTGEADGILHVRAADTSHFEKVLGIIRNHPGVSRTRSSLVLSRL